ncbi:MAG: 50S ribosomal protein L21, partial [Prochlorotrichaceae cyanobacterium]
MASHPDTCTAIIERTIVSMTYAIVESGGNQIWVEPGRFYDVDRLGIEPDEPFNFDRVLLINHEGEVHVGQPYIEGAIVEGTVMSHLRGRKILVYKMRPKKKTRKRQGHRQDLTRIMIDSINMGSISLTSGEEEEDLPISEAELESEVELVSEVE